MKLKSLIGWILILVGFCSGFLIFKSTNYAFKQAGTYPVDYLPYNEAFSRELKDTKKHLLIGNCSLLYEGVKNTLPDLEILFRPTSSIVGVLNYLISKSQISNHRFFAFGAGGSGFAEHLLYTYQASKVSNVESIVYTNFLSAFDQDLINHERLGGALEAHYLLNRILLEYPQLKNEVINYLDYIMSSEQYKNELDLFGPDWQKYVDPHTLTINKFYYLKLFGTDKELFKHYARIFFRSGISFFKMFSKITNIRKYEQYLWDQQIDKGLHEGLTDYHLRNSFDLPRTPFTAQNLEQVFVGNTGKIKLDIIKIMSSIAAAEKAKFIIYSPPLIMTKKYYDEVYYPGFIKPILNEGLLIHDQTLQGNVYFEDFLYYQGNIQGNLVNIIGTFKRAKNLVEIINTSELNAMLSLPLWKNIDAQTSAFKDLNEPN